MDPYLEQPALWPDVHNRLLAAMADAVAPMIAPRYVARLEQRTYTIRTGDLAFVGRPDITVSESHVLAEAAVAYDLTRYEVNRPPSPVWVTIPQSEEVSLGFLEVRGVSDGRVVTVLELLSPANKLTEKGRRQYEEKREEILGTRTNLVEIDLLRAGQPMPVIGDAPLGDYRILVCRGWERPRAQLYAFNLRHPIPVFTLPLSRGEEEPKVDLGVLLHALYERARYDLQLDYAHPPTPPLNESDAAWASALILAFKGASASAAEQHGTTIVS
jgi:hypothetical protein